MIQVFPIEAIGEIADGDPLADILAGAIDACLGGLIDGDVVVVTQKIVSKAEGRRRRLADVTPSAEAERVAARVGKDPRLVELILLESSNVVRAERGVLIARHRLGHVMANAGIDHSNIGPERAEDEVLLLPSDPDAQALALSAAFTRRFGVEAAVIVSDSFGRPWRKGVVGVAIGSAGLPALLDRRGDLDREGRALETTEVAVADLIASAAMLAMGEAAEGLPAAVVRGIVAQGTPSNAAALLRPLDQDLFR